RGERRRLLAELARDRRRDLVDREARAGRDAHDVRREHERDAHVVGDRPRGHRHDRHARATRALQRLLVLLGRLAAEHVHVDRSALRIRDPSGGRRAAPHELTAGNLGQVVRTADRERPVVLRRDAQLLQEAAGCPERYRERHYRRRRVRPCAWIASNTPVATRFAIIDEPPTLTNGKGMPVIGAMPIVIPAFTKTWKRNATTIPPATIDENRSPATVTTRRPRQTTSRYSPSSRIAPKKPRSSP